jgi:hypothetical protein
MTVTIEKKRADRVIQNKKWRLNNPEKARENARRYISNLRLRALQHIANKRTNGLINCECCKEGTIQFLSIDHIKGGGRKDTREGGGRAQFYRRILRGERDGELRILCYNCNCSRGHNGYCPHDI